MRVFAIAQGLLKLPANGVVSRECCGIGLVGERLYLGQILGDRAVIVSRMPKCLLRARGSKRQRRVAVVSLGDDQVILILIGVSQHSQISVVLGGSANHGRATDVYIFYRAR